jgi:hypothetical protein
VVWRRRALRKDRRHRFFELDPADPHNQAIADIDLAPRNARGRVEFSADLFILAPQDPARASGSVLFEMSNRGGKGC